MDRRVTPKKRVTSPTWGLPPPCKQALREVLIIFWMKFLYDNAKNQSLVMKHLKENDEMLTP